MNKLLMICSLLSTAIFPQENTVVFNDFDPCVNISLNPNGESTIKCAYRQELSSYLKAQTLTAEEAAALTVGMSESESYTEGLEKINTFYSS